MLCSMFSIRPYRISSLISSLLINLRAVTMPFPIRSPSSSPYSISSTHYRRACRLPPFRSFFPDVPWARSFSSIAAPGLFDLPQDRLDIRPLGLLEGDSGGKVLFLQARHVMIHMTHEHVDQRPRADGIATGSAAAVNGLLRHVSNGKQICPA